jgi:sugar/nucleoside kinase (ribokinase family)
MNLDVLVIGKTGFDIFVSGKELKPGLVDRDGSVTLLNNHAYGADHSVYEVGGSGMNAAITFARQGIKAGCISRTGKDYLANQIKLVQKNEGLEPELIINKPEHHTDLNFHIVTDRASEILINYENSNNSLSSKDFNYPDLTTRTVYLSELPTDFRLYKYLAKWAKMHGAQIFLNMDDPKGYRTSQINYVLSTAENIMMSLQAGASIFNEVFDAKEIIRQLLAFGARTVLLYDVTQEAYACVDKSLFTCGTYKNLNPLDLTGANDVFAAGFASMLIQKRSIVEALTFASANACSVMEVMGTRAGILKKPALRSMKVESGDL